MTKCPHPPHPITLIALAVALCGLTLALPSPSDAQHSGNESRTWTSNDGRTLQGQLVSATNGNVVIKIQGGQRYEFPLTRLSETDQQYVNELSAKGLTVKVGTMPTETRIPTQVKVEGGPEIFTTEHFEFHADEKLSKAFISEAARVYEGTYQALSELPVGLKMRPPEGMNRFRGLFLNRDAFEKELAIQPTLVPIGGSRTVVAGVYVPKRKELLVPYSSLGARNNGSQKTLRKSSDTSTLVHEVVHQVMHDYLPLMPLWFVEGFAEYLNAVPYQNGRFEFKNLERGLKAHLEKKYNHLGGSIQMRHPEDIMIHLTKEFRFGTMDGYRDSMLLFTYLMHFDRPSAVGAPVAAFLNVYDVENFNPQKFIDDYNAAVKKYNSDRGAYNEDVDRYNKELADYRRKFAEANERIDDINAAIQRGIPEDRLPKQLPEPKPPTPPGELVLPAILKDNPNGPTDVFASIHERAAKVITRDRTPEEIGEKLKQAYAGIGIDISYHPKASRESSSSIKDGVISKLKGGF